MKFIKDYLIKCLNWFLGLFIKKKVWFQWNPFLKYPRNEKCYCKSGLKYKKCCLKTEPIAIQENFAIAAKPLIKTMRKVKKRAKS